MADEEQLSIGTLVRDLVVAINGQARAKPHPLLYVNLAFVLSIVFACGVLYQRVNDLDGKVAKVQSTEGLSTRVESMQSELNRLTQRLDTFLDNPDNRPRPR